jgi:hypothetical protein
MTLFSSEDGQKLASCSICANVRGLREHLVELGRAAELLDNRSTYSSEHGAATITTVSIGKWLTLASGLERVYIDTWKYSGEAGLYCEPVANSLDEHSKHYSNHATALTLFMFVCNALEEAYRFIDHLYLPLAQVRKIPRDQLKRTASLRAGEILDDLFRRQGDDVLPPNFDHLTGNFISLFRSFEQAHKSSSGKVGKISPVVNKTYALDLIRKLRNYVAHGTFPIGPPVDYGGYADSELLLQLLKHGCRTAVIYMQIILYGYCSEFQSDDYRMMEGANGPEFELFIKNCNLNYVKNLHLRSEFSLHNCLDI